MSKLRIITNNHTKELLSSSEVPTSVLLDSFEHLVGEMGSDAFIGGFFCYRRQWYHMSDFQALPANISEIWCDDSPMRSWHGYVSDSCFSGVLIRYDEIDDVIQVATYVS